MPFILSGVDLGDDDRVLLFHEGRLLLYAESVFWRRQHLQSWLEELNELHLVAEKLAERTVERKQRFFATTVSTAMLEALNAQDRSLRSLVLAGDEELLATAGKANQILDWYQSHRYCGACGEPTEAHPRDRAVICRRCERHYFPRINPCVIVLITRGDEILLARNKRYRSGYYSCLAGFIEIGESAEDTVHREIMEEVGLQVDNIRYITSQSWPFPSQLMLGYYADYVSGEIVPEEAEIEDAAWFDVRQLPSYPSSQISVAGELIAGYTASRLANRR
jgi:NAD+ diphosphatase